MKQLRSAVRLTRLSVHVLNGMVLTVVFGGMLRVSFDAPLYQRLMGWWLRKVGHILGARVTVMGEPAGQGVLMVANHISWLDIPLLGGFAKPRFLSKQEVRDWPVIGSACKQGGNLVHYTR